MFNNKKNCMNTLKLNISRICNKLFTFNGLINQEGTGQPVFYMSKEKNNNIISLIILINFLGIDVKNWMKTRLILSFVFGILVHANIQQR